MPRQTPYAIAEPATKLHLILLPKRALLTDVMALKMDALEAEAKGSLTLAKELWIRVLAASPADPQAIEGIMRIALKMNASPGQAIENAVERASVSAGVADRQGSISATPKQLQTLSFDVVTVNSKGKEIKRLKCENESFREDLGDGIYLDLMKIPAGEFMMGSPDGERFSIEKPQHQVTIAEPFWMGRYQITQAQWRAVASLPKVDRDLNPDPSGFKGDNLPVEQISWYDAVEFCARLSQQIGRDYRLPSEAEWEYACRAGTTTPFHFGPTITTDLANYRGTEWDYQGTTYPGFYDSGPEGIFREETTEVGSFGIANAFGLYDMHGNVLEWCADPWHKNYKNAPNDGTIWEEGDNKEERIRLLRGGSWFYLPVLCRSANRSHDTPGFSLDHVGFRLVLGSAPR